MKSVNKILFIVVLTLSLIACKKEDTPDTRPKDIDGNVYDTIIIGTQVWMMQNLNTTRYNDGGLIGTGLSNTFWGTTTTGAYTDYDGDAANSVIYGKLYNWNAVNTGKLAPKGWHVPTDPEWMTLITYLGGTLEAGQAMKADKLWDPSFGIMNANSSGFSGLPAGYRLETGTYSGLHTLTYFWSSSEYDADFAWSSYLVYDFKTANHTRYLGKRNGFSVRCIRD